MDIGIDYDGTCVTYAFPNKGLNIGAGCVLRELVRQGHRLILWTMRSNCTNNTGFSAEVPKVINGMFLDEAITWFKNEEIELYGIQRNPQQDEWTSSPKCYAQLYIDDIALGCPLIYPSQDKHSLSDRPYVDWISVVDRLVWGGVLDSSKFDYRGLVKQINIEIQSSENRLTNT